MATQHIARYTLTLYVDRPLIGLRSDAKTKRKLEGEVLRALKKLDGDCDCEVVDTEIVTEEA